MSTESNKQIIHRYFEEVVDGRADIFDQLFTPDCLIHRPEFKEPIRGLEQLRRYMQMSRMSIQEQRSTIHEQVAEGDRVAVRVSHRVVFAGSIMTPLGIREVKGKSVEWSAMAMFRFQDGLIAEEWINRDELGILRQLGVFERSA